MKAVYVAIILLFAGMLAQPVQGQKRTVETRTPVDSTTTVVVTQTEDITPRYHLINVNPLEFLLFYNVTYYQRISDGLALGGGVRVPTIKGIEGAGIQAETRFYTSKRALKGFYVAPKISLNRLSAGEGHVMASSIGIRGGWQWFLSRDFAMGFGLGIDYYVLSGSNDEGDFNRYEGKVPALRFDIGYAF